MCCEHDAKALQFQSLRRSERPEPTLTLIDFAFFFWFVVRVSIFARFFWSLPINQTGDVATREERVSATH